MDLARHVPFVTKTGMASRDFPRAASEALAAFGTGTGDFPGDPLLSDDVWCGGQFSAPFGDKARGDIRSGDFASGDRIEPIRIGTLDSTPFSFAALDKAFGAYVPGPGRPVPNIGMVAGAMERIGRSADGTRIVAVGASLLKLLEICDSAATAGELAPRLAAATRTDGTALIGKLRALGLIRLRRNADAVA
jgi:hypothetical protein